MLSSPESMSLGSPNQSLTYQMPPSQYLPQFLLGDSTVNPHLGINTRNNTPQMGSRYINSNNSPTRNIAGAPHYHHHSTSISPLSRSYSINPYDQNRPNNQADKSEFNYFHPGHSPHNDRSIASSTIFGLNKEKSDPKSSAHTPGAPPINRLIDIANKPSFNNVSYNETPDSRMRIKREYFLEDNSYNQESQVFALNSLKLSPSSPNQLDPFYTHGESIRADENLDDTWVTIFGFTPSATSYVLQEFAQYGQIIRHLPSPQGNWMHIQYQTKLQAQKALSKNGKILSNSLMVGVMPCLDKAAMNMSRPSINLSLNSTDDGASYNTDRSQTIRNAGIRPLGNFNRTLDKTSPAKPNSANLPKKNTNVLSKAMEYMFGW